MGISSVLKKSVATNRVPGNAIVSRMRIKTTICSEVQRRRSLLRTIVTRKIQNADWRFGECAPLLPFYKSALLKRKFGKALFKGLVHDESLRAATADWGNKPSARGFKLCQKLQIDRIKGG